MIQKIWNISLYYRTDTKNTKKVEDFIESSAFQKFLQQLHSEMIIVLWGDGTMLWAIDELGDKNIPFYGINLWNKWFLLNDEKFLSPKYKEKKYPLFEWILTHKWQTKTSFAFNEFDIRTANGRVIDLDIQLWSDLHFHLSWDGVIISTPLWSTGYNSSLGWPILPHHSNMWIITPKAPWKPKHQLPIIFPLEKEVTLQRVRHMWPIEIYRDGRHFWYIEKEEIFSFTFRKREKDITLLISEDYVDIWENKIYLEQGFQLRNNWE